MEIRHQLAAHSPITLAAALSGLTACTRLTHDPRPELEGVLRVEFGADDVVLCGSGTQALQLAIGQVLAGGRDDRPVAIPAFGCFDIISATIGARVKVALYDIDPSTLAPDLSSLDRVLAAGASACVLTPLYGVPLPWDELSALAARRGVPLIYDAAQGHGASWEGRPLASLGKLSVISFGRGKGWTGGEGGALLRRDDSFNSRPSMRTSGTATELTTVIALLAQWAIGRPQLYGLARSIPVLGLGMTQYHAPKIPATITRSAAAAALATHKHSASEANVRRQNASTLLASLRSIDGVTTFPIPTHAEAGFIRLPVRLKRGLRRRTLARDARRLGIERSYPHSLARLPSARPWLTNGDASLPGADALAEQLITLPTHSLLDWTDRHAIVRTVTAMTREV